MTHHAATAALRAASEKARGPWDHLELGPRSVAPERAVWLSSLADELRRLLPTLGPELCEFHRRGVLRAAGMRLARLDLSAAVDISAMAASEVRDGLTTYHLLLVRRA